MVEALLAAGAKPEMPNNIRIPLQAATMRGDAKMIEALGNAGAKPSRHEGPANAAAANDIEALRAMLAARW